MEPTGRSHGRLTSLRPEQPGVGTVPGLRSREWTRLRCCRSRREGAREPPNGARGWGPAGSDGTRVPSFVRAPTRLASRSRLSLRRECLCFVGPDRVPGVERREGSIGPPALGRCSRRSPSDPRKVGGRLALGRHVASGVSWALVRLF